MERCALTIVERVEPQFRTKHLVVRPENGHATRGRHYWTCHDSTRQEPLTNSGQLAKAEEIYLILLPPYFMTNRVPQATHIQLMLGM